MSPSEKSSLSESSGSSDKQSPNNNRKSSYDRSLDFSARGSSGYFSHFGRPLLNPNDENSEHLHHNGYHGRQRARSASENDIHSSSLSRYSSAFKFSGDSHERLYAHDVSYVPEPVTRHGIATAAAAAAAPLFHTEDHLSLHGDRRNEPQNAQSTRNENMAPIIHEGDSESSQNFMPSSTTVSRRSTKSTATMHTHSRSRLGKILDSFRGVVDFPKSSTSRRSGRESTVSQVPCFPFQRLCRIDWHHKCFEGDIFYL